MSVEKNLLEYCKTRKKELKDTLIVGYAPLVKLVAGRMSMHIGQYVEFEDLVSYGIFGLIDAIDKFDPDKGIKFETYASLRIRGSIIDSIRKLDWVPRTLRQKGKQLDSALLELELALGRKPTDSELAVKLSISVEAAAEMLSKPPVASLVSLDDFIEQNGEITFDYFGTIKGSETPERHYEKQELIKYLSQSIDKLTDKERKVITLYYYENLTLKEISKVLEVSESRISQIHTKAIFKLKASLEADFFYNSNT